MVLAKCSTVIEVIDFKVMEMDLNPTFAPTKHIHLERLFNSKIQAFYLKDRD